ncbi:PAS domain S-box protein [Paraburkholderia phenazinium]|jgi:PAS domain S-box-containing protein|uniref:PAS domain S-box-containing protein n=1 Tax=Paraburkholderia phenazinium TaxID=60549 RepID=A0A1G7RYY4_9BURK|nr:PAS domain S-box protein [Paraburkholderia phenazinium]SDG15977.1 PAS domain S-box-containing protein [Paraburkholderia phenazinium]
MHFSPRHALRSLSLHAKLMLALALLVAVVASSSAYVVAEHERERRLSALEQRASRIADLLSHSLAQPLWNVDRTAIDEQLAALAPNPEVVEYTVTATNYGTVSSVKGPHPDGSNDNVVRVRPIEYTPPGDAPREKIGEVRVVFTRAVAEQSISAARRAILWTVAAIVAALYLVTFVLLKRMVRGPINRLEEMVDRIAGGDLHARCVVESGDELGRLALRVNSMADRLHQSTTSLRENERKYRSIVENALEGIFLLDRCGRLTEANPAMAHLLGYPDPAELIAAGAAASYEHPFAPEQTAELFDILRAKGEIVGVELRLTRLDGVPIWVELNARGVNVDGNYAPLLEGLMTDVTARKRVVENLRRHSAQLEREVAERKRTEAELLASRERLRQLSAHLEAIREEERKRIAMEIHDDLGQLLTALKMDVSLLRMHLVDDSAALHKANGMRELVEKTIEIVRGVASHLRPAALNFGLASALEWLAHDFTRYAQIPCHFHLEGPEPRLPDASATAIFRIAQESLTNVARHANASRVDVTLCHNERGIELTIRDDGRGFDVAAAREGYSYGLLGMTERARLIDANLRFESTTEAGCVIRLSVGATSIATSC